MSGAGGRRARTVTVETLASLAAAQGLTIDASRLQQLVPLVQALWDGADELEALDVDGIAPAPVFRAEPAAARDDGG